MSTEMTTIHLEPSSESCSVTAYHRDFPEIRACGNSNLEAVTLLGHQLTRAIDSALTDWRRDSLQGAIDDVQNFAKNHGK